MDLETIKNMIIESINKHYGEIGIEIVADANTNLFGTDSKIDSLGLVTILIDIESAFFDLDIQIALMSDKAMSLKNSPFKTVTTLAEFILDELRGNHA